MPMRNLTRILLPAIVLAVAQAMTIAQAQTQAIVGAPIPTQPIADALNEFSRQTGLQVVYMSKVADGMMSTSIPGGLAPEQALRRILGATGLDFEFLNERTVTVFVAGSLKAVGQRSSLRDSSAILGPMRVAQSDAAASLEEEEQGEDAKEQTVGEDKDEEDFERAGIPEILVTGSKLGTLNTDVKRTEDDVQPYVVFDRRDIEESGAMNIEEFLKNELTMSVSSVSGNQLPGREARSEVNLRGLGSDETLILVDGRRIAGFNDGIAGPQQSSISGVPLAAIERIEVLPTTASGIYGGGATGGVINIVLRRDYSGLETALTYGSPFNGGARSVRVDVSMGTHLESGRTNILFAGSHADVDPLLTEDRDFARRGRAHILAHNPSFFHSGFQPPLGATPNIQGIDPTTFSPTNLTLDDGTELHSPITFVPAGYMGVSADGGAALVASAGNFNLDLARTADGEGGGRNPILTASRVSSAMLTVRREFSPRVHAFLDVRASDTAAGGPYNTGIPTILLAADAVSNPFQQPIMVRVPGAGLDNRSRADAEDAGMSAGVVLRLPQDWQAGLDFIWSRSRNSFEYPPNVSGDAVAALGNGSIDVLRDIQQFPLNLMTDPLPSTFATPADAVARGLTLRMAGPLNLHLPGGAVTLSTMLERREESLDSLNYRVSGLDLLIPTRSQSVNSVYLETKWPLFTARNRMPGLELLELQLAARRDEYNVEGATGAVLIAAPQPIVRLSNQNSSTDPTIGLKFQPLVDLTLRASYGTGYLPPSVNQLIPFVIPNAGTSLTDPLRGNERIGLHTRLTGGNPSLRPEESDSLSAGVVLAPRWAPGMRVSVDWTQIKKSDNISSLSVFAQESFELLMRIAPDRIVRGEPSGGFSVGPITQIDGSLINLARMEVEALDWGVDYQVDMGRVGALDLSLDATHLISQQVQAAPTEETVEHAGLLGFLGNAGGLKLRTSGSLNWTYQDWRFGWRTRYLGSYFLNTAHAVDVNQGSASVPSQIYHDFFGSYEFSRGSGMPKFLENTGIQIGVNNIFNKEPPIDVGTTAGYPPFYSYLGDPRLANYYVSIRKGF